MSDDLKRDGNAFRAEDEADLVALLGSRLCHDLVSPLGAIHNGLELIELSGSTSGDEMALIRQSLDAALARIAFFRLAFGSAARDAVIPQRDLRAAISAMYRESRTEVIWRDEEDRPRSEIRLACLALLCVETAIPWGAKIEVTRNPNAWVFHVDAKRLKIEPALWQALGRGAVLADLTGAQVQFGILARACRALRRPVSVSADETHLSLLV
ncbi:histidine phosphotransferase family protein [Jannaschia seohaensis]|uniref:Histidine phosphotransferase ChpT n=1 Tax=Jannaschia seohaensis TaxID=475081 RepID=A0A2Y9AF91_9RHOB|nr:histidine phosphotransferase family protein [Jannaschia seohaensis]PWJ20839.1 histidine phosphotransferase ChpT [Jannaschia seohaensis]SSA41249.1 histidine phosphotransferase ChpT [Jannaschia seohaensis]